MTVSLNNFQLKIIGIILMLFDHIHYHLSYVFDIPIWFRMLGRPVAILFIFLTVEGFIHTRSKLKYMRNLLFGYWFMVLSSNTIQHFFPTNYGNLPQMHTIFGTLFLSVFFMYSTEKILDGFKNKQFKKVILGFSMIIFWFLWNFILLILFNAANTNYENSNLIFLMIVTMGIFPTFFVEVFYLAFVGLGMYLLRKKRIFQIILIFGVSMFILIMNMKSSAISFENLVFTNFQWMMVFSVIPIYLYNGEKGRSMKYLFYVFYPLHIYILYFISYML